MLITVNGGGWTADKGRDELGVQIKIIGSDPIDVEHLEAIVVDDWTVSKVEFAGGALTFDVKVSRKAPLDVQLAATQPE